MTPLRGQTSEEQLSVRQQLDRLLVSPHFRSSKRCQSLLKHVVEAYLDGALDQVKERFIGSEVFGRDQNYDTNRDSVVRTTAADVRKRLAQYYLEPEHEREVRFLLPPGSYVPEFRWPDLPAVVEPVPIQVLAPPKPTALWRIAGALALISIVIVVIAILPRWRRNELDAFWKPLIDDSADVVICIEQPLRLYTFDGPRIDDLNEKMVGPKAGKGKETPLTLAELKAVGSRYFSFGDTLASMRISELLARKGKSFQVLGDRATSYHDLRGRPAVLVGEFNNQWTNGLIHGLRYYIERNAETHTYDVRDRENGGRVIASASRSPGRPVEYAVVSRVFDNSTEKTIVAIAGMTYAGNGAVGDFLTNQAYLHEAFKNAPADWSRKSIQVVLETALVGGVAGPPKVLTTHFW